MTLQIVKNYMVLEFNYDTEEYTEKLIDSNIEVFTEVTA